MKNSIAKILELAKQLPELKSQFTVGYGMYSLNTISNTPAFSLWKSEMIYELNKLKQTQFIKDFLSTLNSFNGWNDKTLFEEIVSKTNVLAKNYNDFSVGDNKMTTNNKNCVFISHRSTDKKIADMLLDFFIGTGIPRDTVFCSSLPGNDVRQKIPSEVKDAMKNSIVNIAILSNDYYQSAYCLNEEGVIWYSDATIIPIALPEVSSDNMIGFLNNDYKIRRLNCDDDIAYIYDLVRESISANQAKTSIVVTETGKLKKRYSEYTASRVIADTAENKKQTIKNFTDDEQVVLYYIVTEKVRKVAKKDISAWLINEELYNVNIDNAFDLLSSLQNSKVTDDTLELDIDLFRNISCNPQIIIGKTLPTIELHRRLAREEFLKLWTSNKLCDDLKLFVAYIVDEKQMAFGSRWLAEKQIEQIKKWENENGLVEKLSICYEACLKVFIEHHFVYEYSWTSYGNPREYKLFPSLQNYLLNGDFEYTDELSSTKGEYKSVPI